MMVGKGKPGIEAWKPGGSRGLRSRRLGKFGAVSAGVVVAIVFLAVGAYQMFGHRVIGEEAGPARETRSPAGVASTLPDYPLILYQGQDILGSDSPRFYDLLGKRPVVLNYWASNCAPCSAEMPEFERVWRKYKGQVLFVGLDVGRFFPGFGGPDDSKKALRRLGITYVAGTPSSVEVVEQLGVLGLPSTAFITPGGKVHKRWTGSLNEAKLTELVEDLLRTS